MLLTPRYGTEPVVSIEVRTAGEHPLVRQRARLSALLAALRDDEWQHPSRCDGWTVQDVVSHLTSTNGFWAFSIRAGLGDEPTRFLGAFDPVASPAELVDQGKGTPVATTLEEFVASAAALAEVIAALTDADWHRLAEAPPGHLPIWLVADHALWDSWVHERDIVLPLGRPAVIDADEVLTCLRYGAALGRAFVLCRGSREQGAMGLTVTAPDAELVVAVDGDTVRVHDGSAPDGAAVLQGDAVEILEMLSMRDVGREPPAGIGWLTAGLAEVFDQAPAV